MSRNRKTVVTMVVGVAVSAQMLWGCGAASAASRSSASANRTHTEAPSAPTRVVAKATDHQVVVNWVAPSATGNGRVTNYVVLALRGNKRYWTFGDLSTATTLTLNYMNDGVTYRFEVAAENSSNLIGPYSSASSPVTPSPIVEVTNSLSLETAPSVSGSLCAIRIQIPSDECFDLQQNFFVANGPAEKGSSPITAPPFKVPPFWLQNIVVIFRSAQGQWLAQPQAFVLLGSSPQQPIACSGFPSTPGVCKKATRSVELKDSSFPATIVVKSVVSRNRVRFYDSLLGSSPFFTWSEPSRGSGTTSTLPPTTIIGSSHVPVCAFSPNGCPVAYSFAPFNIVSNPNSVLYQGAPEAVLVGWDEGDPTAGFLAGTRGSIGSELRLSNGVVATHTVCALPSSKAETAEKGKSLQWTVSPGGVAHFSYMSDSMTEGVAFLPQTLPCVDSLPDAVVPGAPS